MANTQFLVVLTLSAAYDVYFSFCGLCPDFPVPEGPGRRGSTRTKLNEQNEHTNPFVSDGDTRFASIAILNPRLKAA